MNRSPMKSLITIVAGLGAGISLGCIINAGGSSDECGSVLSHSEMVAGGCKCDAGYQWEDPDDPDNYECEPIPPKPDSGQCDEPNSHPVTNGCQCDDGYNWCSDDPNDYTCCVDPDQNPGTGGESSDSVADTGNDTGTTTNDPSMADSTGDTGDVNETNFDPDPTQCTTETEGSLYCTNNTNAGLADSQYFVCMAGEWVEDPTAAQASCEFDQFDFGYGCITDNESAQINFICGFGAGTDCEPGAEDACVDGDVLGGCLFGKFTEDSCARICNEIGDEEGATYESGFCDASGGVAECVCCDSGEAGCPV